MRNPERGLAAGAAEDPESRVDFRRRVFGLCQREMRAAGHDVADP